MAFDAFFLTAVLDEIREKAVDARVEKIHQPSRDTILIHLKCKNGREKLLFAPNPAAPRLHLTASSPENPAQPPMFCMLLRKHLTGARLADIRQEGFERVVTLEFDTRDEMGFACTRRIVAEIMGKYSNLIFTDGEGKFISAL